MVLISVIVLMSLAILCGLTAIELKNILLSIVSLILMNLFIWITFLVMQAGFIAWFQVICYGGGLAALFLVVVTLTENQSDESFDWKRTVMGGSVASIFTLILVFFLSYVEPFVFDSANTIDIGENSDIITNYMWTIRSTDLLLQALLFFATTLAISALFFQHKQKKHYRPKAYQEEDEVIER